MGRCTLKVCGNCVSPKEGSYTFHNSTSIDVEQRSTTLFIQTDRPVYKPGQKGRTSSLSAVDVLIVTSGSRTSETGGEIFAKIFERPFLGVSRKNFSISLKNVIYLPKFLMT